MKLASERQELILAAVRAQGTVRLADLVDKLGVTPVTVRRDVTVLADRGLVVRVHGGIRLPHRGIAEGSASAARSAFGRLCGGEIGMVVPSVEYYWPTVIRGVQSAVTAAGGRLLLRASAYDPAEDRRQVTKLLDRGMQCLLVAPSTEGSRGLDLLRWLGSLNVSVILMERVPPPELPVLALDAAYTAHGLGAGMAVRHLVTLGHRRIGLVTSRSSPTSRALRRGWSEAVSTLGLPEVLTAEVPAYGQPCWAQAYDELLRRCREHDVHALIVHADREAIGFLERAQELGIDVPGDLAVVTYDDEVAAASDPPLTAVCPQKYRLGALAAELALTRLADGAERPVHRVELWPTLVIRESCGTPAR
ncbi:substrate-binding domain-containing protein [Kutzneria sp. NPDC051319]|uniref:substrate-binding domain-containing protein n=1 Tax=Kutzneria sp. NPDC051319 TaxID=3155047 RepID=UPI00342AF762